MKVAAIQMTSGPEVAIPLQRINCFTDIIHRHVCGDAR